MSSLEHQPVLLAEVLAGLRPQPGGVYVDGTLGGGGHAAALLGASSPSGRLFGCDRDGVAVAGAGRRLAEYSGRFELRQGSFAQLGEWVTPGSCDGVLLDLGISSVQLDDAGRGFSFQSDGPLDMRMTAAGPTAADLVNELSMNELARIFWELGGERDARRIARAIESDRCQRPFTRTRQLAGLIERVVGRRGPTHPATRVFLALRMKVNDELGALTAGLPTALSLLKPGGRLGVITFHSVEDRLVREFGRRLERDYEAAGAVDVPELRRPRAPQLRWVHRKAIAPSVAEVAANPRSRSAQLRLMEKIQ